MSVLKNSHLLPFRQYAEAEVINLFSLDGTGLAGQLVAIDTGSAQDPATSAGSYTSNPVGFDAVNTYSTRHVITRKVRVATAGDTKANILGVTLHTTAEYDENGNKLILQPMDKTYERGYVMSGFAVPVLARGVVTVKNSNLAGTVLPGFAVVAAADGVLSGVDPATLSGTADLGLVVGKFISGPGSAFGGYAQIKLEL